MCLKIDAELTSELRMSGQNSRKRFTVYKEVMREFAGHPYESVNQNYHYKSGKNVSNRYHDATLTETEKTEHEVHFGIHVYLHKPQKFTSYSRVIIPLTVYLKDLVAAGYHDSDYTRKPEKQQAVFTKVHFRKRDYERLKK